MDLTLVIPAAGRGERLSPSTSQTPKTMLSVAGRPILEYVLEVGARLPVDRIVIIVGSNGHLIRDFCGASCRGIPVTYCEQQEPLGLVHAVSLSEPLVRDHLLVLLGDELYVGSRHSELCQYLNEKRADGLCGFVRTTARARIGFNYGLEIDVNSRVKRLVEKPRSAWNDLLGTGTWLFNRQWFDFLDRTPTHSERGERDFVAVIQKMVDEDRVVCGIDLGGLYVNVNTLADLQFGELLVRSQPLAAKA